MWYNVSLGVGVLLIIIALFVLKESLAFLKVTERAEATVIQLVDSKDADGVTVYSPVFTFETYNKQEVTYKYPFSSSSPSWYIGDKAIIAYLPEKPSAARLVTYFGTFGWTVILIAIASPLIVIGLGYYLTQPFLK